MKALWLGVFLALPAAAVTLVDNGRSDYSICIAQQAPPPDRRAADELRRFLVEMSGADLPVAEQCPQGRRYVYVGASEALRRARPDLDLSRFGLEEFELDTRGPDIVIAGGQPRGTLYGVYTFLDRLGCRWYTREVSRIPKRKIISVTGSRERLKPAFEYREVFITEAFDRDWAARNRTNGNRANLDASTGGKIEYYPFVHSFYELIPPAKYFKEHPEYFSLIDGARRVERGQLCLTNPEVLKLAVARVREWIREHPAAKIISVSQNDWGGWCECDPCRRAEQEEGGQHSGPLLRFVNTVAEEIEKTNPDKWIDTLAYWYTENPPAKVRPRPNVRIRLCPIGVCVAHPYEQCPRSAYFLKNLQAWSRITNQLYIWHYNTNFSHYLAPFPDFDELAADIPLYRKHGVVGLFMQGSYAPDGGGENAELRAYVLARLLWDPSINVNREIDEFLNAVYGPAAKPMRRYFDLLHREVRQTPAGLGQHLWIFNLPVFSNGFRPEADRIFQEALGSGAEPAVRRRIESARLPLEYMDLWNARQYRVRDGSYEPDDLAGWKSRFEVFAARLRGFGISSIREGRSLDDDLKSAANLRSYPAVSIENERWKVVIAPDLGGRIVQMIERRRGQNILRTTWPGDGGYPDTGGQFVQAAPDYPVRAWPTTWKLGSHDAREVVLEGRCADSVRLTRRILLEGDRVRTELAAANTGAEAVDLTLQSRADFEPGDITAARTLGRLILVPDEPPAGNETLSLTSIPDGIWTLSRAGLPDVIVRFAIHRAGRATLNWTAKGGPRVSFGVWSPRTSLAAGERFQLDVEYMVR